MNSRRTLLLAFALLALAVLFVMASQGSAATVNVDLKNAAFAPRNLTINVGDTVVWTNKDGFVHDVNSDTAIFSSGAAGSLAPGATFSYTFSATGTYPYHCIVHAPAMVGTIKVIDPALYPTVTIAVAPPARVLPGASFTVSGSATDATGVTEVFVQVDSAAPAAANVTEVSPGVRTNVSWSLDVSTLGLSASGHTLSVWAINSGGYNSSEVAATTVAFAVGAPSGGGPSGNPFGDTFVFEDVMTKYFWLMTGVGIIALVLILMFLAYSGKLQNYYITLLTALDERHRLFSFTRPTREFIYTIQRQMPRTHTERYNLKVIWYWYPLYCLGGLAFAAFIIETITGIILGFYYIPEGTGPNVGAPSPAYTSMETIMTKVTFGYIFRALHHWGAHMMVATVFLHMMRVYFVGAYKNPRELNWLLGVLLLNVTLLFGYTGYLLPWDQLSFWAGQIGLEMAYTIPVIGEILGNMVFGGPELSPATIIRMYYLHVFILPIVGGALMVLHMTIVWMQGVAEPH